jgi:hypothetical protein
MDKAIRFHHLVNQQAKRNMTEVSLLIITILMKYVWRQNNCYQVLNSMNISR